MTLQIPVEITSRHIEHSAALETRTRALAARLEKFSPQILHCQIVIQTPHRRHSQGKLFEVSIHLKVPGQQIDIHHTKPADHSHENAYVALRDAFKAARRKLQEYERERRGDVKTHVELNQTYPAGDLPPWSHRID